MNMRIFEVNDNNCFKTTYAFLQMKNQSHTQKNIHGLKCAYFKQERLKINYLNTHLKKTEREKDIKLNPKKTEERKK